jgi:hypothetical protein
MHRAPRAQERRPLLSDGAGTGAVGGAQPGGSGGHHPASGARLPAGTGDGRLRGGVCVPTEPPGGVGAGPANLSCRHAGA